MANFITFYSFSEALAEKVHNLGSDTLKLALSNTAPALTNTQFSDITEIASGNGYSAGGATISGVTSLQTLGAYNLAASDLVITATGGAIGPFRYLVIYNETATNNELIGYLDYGSALTLASTDTFTAQLSDGILTIG